MTRHAAESFAEFDSAFYPEFGLPGLRNETPEQSAFAVEPQEYMKPEIEPVPLYDCDAPGYYGNEEAQWPPEETEFTDEHGNPVEPVRRR